MANKKTPIWVYLVPVVIGGGLLFYFLRRKDEQPKESPVTPPETGGGSPTTTGEFPLKIGSRGETVRRLQSILGITADGIFGSKTEAALVKVTGKSTVDSASELDAIKSKKSLLDSAEIARQGQTAVNQSRRAQANQIKSFFDSKSSGFRIVTLTLTTDERVSEGNWDAATNTPKGVVGKVFKSGTVFYPQRGTLKVDSLGFLSFISSYNDKWYSLSPFSIVVS